MSFFLEDQMIEKAEMGDTLNMYMLGREYSGFGAYCKNPELEKAFFWLHKSADLGELSSMVLLGEIYCGLRQGINIEYPIDKGKGLYWLQKAAGLDCKDAFYALGDFYKKDKEFFDIDKSIEYLQSGAFTGAINCINELGQMYYEGKNVAQNFEKAFNWFRIGVEKGAGSSMKWLGIMYYNGFGVDEDPRKAFECFEKGVKAKIDPISYGGIARLFDQGKYVPKDYDLAKEYYEKDGDSGAIKILDYNHKRNKTSNNDSMCFITSSVCNSLGKPDNCYELTMFRNFRDNWLKKQIDGEAIIKNYYNIAPIIISNIDLQKNSKEIYYRIWIDYLKPCLTYLENNDRNSCKLHYIKMVTDLKEKYLFSYT